MSKNDRIIYRRSDGKWVNKRIGASKAATLHDTQKDAAANAHQMITNSGGGELIIKGVNGKIRSKDTVPPGKDPLPPRDTEH